MGKSLFIPWIKYLDRRLELHQARPATCVKSLNNLHLALSSSKFIRLLLVIVSPSNPPPPEHNPPPLSARRQLVWRRILNLMVFVPGPLLTLDYRLKHSDYCLTSLNMGRKKCHTKMQCSLSKIRFHSPSPFPTSQPPPPSARRWFLEMIQGFLQHDFVRWGKDGYCPDSASLTDRSLNVTLRKRQHLNFSWTANALFLGFPPLCVSPGTVILWRGVGWIAMRLWESLQKPA